MGLRRNAQRFGGFKPTNLPGCVLWLRADSLAMNDGDPVGTWSDSSGQGNDFTQGTAAAKPTYKVSQFSALPGVSFDGIDDGLLGPNLLSGATAGTGFVARKIDADPPSANAKCGCWQFGNSASENPIPWTDGVIYDDFGSTVRQTTANPAASMANAHVYEVLSAASDWRNYLNGTLVSETTTNTVGWRAAPVIGAALAVTVYFQSGPTLEVVVYNRALSNEERSTVRQYLGTRVGATVS